MMIQAKSRRVLTLTLNPAIDQSVAVTGFTAGSVNRVVWEQSDPGGKGVNVASFLADLGHPGTVTGLLGRDNATEFEHLFKSKGIVDEFVRIPGKTRVNIKIIDETTQAITDLNFPGCAVSPADLVKLERRIDSLLPEQDWLVLSGSTPAGVSADYYARLIRRLNAAGKRVVLDSSGEALRLGIAALPWAIKPNIHELEELLGKTLPDTPAVIGAARELLARGLGCVVVSMGEQGALFLTASECLHAQPPEIEVKSTVGAGDAMVAGFIAGQLRGLSLADSARLATASALGALTQLGPRLPSAETIASYMQQVVVRDATH
ncbi:MAG: 1-phosphofructokinase [Thiotrichales bacterium]